jgi:hypothetical protein
MLQFGDKSFVGYNFSCAFGLRLCNYHSDEVFGPAPFGKSSKLHLLFDAAP